MSRKLRSLPFGKRPGEEPYNASEVLALADSRFLFCDNNVSDSLFEFRVRGDGTLGGRLQRRRIEGLDADAIDDLEGIEIVRAAGRTYIFGTSSLCLKTRKGQHKKRKRGKVLPARESIVRITVEPRGRLRAEVMPDFRPWLIEHTPWLRRAAGLIPDDGGLNVEALSWDPRRQALLFGLRTPSIDGRPVILRVKPRQIDGPWTVDNLRILPPLKLAVPADGGESGLRAMSLDQATGRSLIILGNATSASKAPFRLYEWDGNPRGLLRHHEGVRFHKRMKVEGVTRGTVGGRSAVVFVDDAGGFQVLWGEDERLLKKSEGKREKAEGRPHKSEGREHKSEGRRQKYGT
jgi:hypothetical protein